MQLLRSLPLSLVFVVLSTVVNAVPIQSETPETEDDSIVWVTETVWPCGGPSATNLAVASDTTYSATRGASQKNADYDTVPVDGSENTESVAQEAVSSSSTETGDPTVVAVPETSAELAPVATDPAESTTGFTTPTTTSSETLIYTAVNDDPIETASSASETVVDAELTSASAATMTSSSTIPVDPVLTTTKAPVAYAVNTTSTAPGPTMPLVLPTFIMPVNGTNTSCTALPEDDDYTPEEESAYWATATEPSIIYSDYTVMVTMKSTSIITISTTADIDPVTTAVAASVTTTSSQTTLSNAIAATAIRYINATTASSEDDSPTYTLDSVGKQAVTASADPVATTVAAATNNPSLTTETMTTSTTTPTLDVTSMTDSSEPALQTVSGTVITYVDVTTTIDSDSATTTVLETVTTTPTNSTVDSSNSSDIMYDTTTTTTTWVTSTITVEETATANARIRRRILVTRGG